jgi:hypothetical protein
MSTKLHEVTYRLFIISVYVFFLLDRPLVPKFAGLNPAEAVGFFRAKKSSARLPSEGK